MSKRFTPSRTALIGATAAVAVSSVLAAPAFAQPGYVQVPTAGQAAYSNANVPPPPPPPGQNDQGYYDNRGDDRSGYNGQADQRYDNRGAPSASEQQAYYDCVQKKRSSTTAGAVIGGVLGAVVGSQMGARGVRTEGGLMGAGVGALAGGAIGNSSGQACPPGYAAYGPREVYAEGPPPPPPPPPPGGYYAEPPVVYYAPPPVYYAPGYYGGPSVDLYVSSRPHYYGRGYGRRW